MITRFRSGARMLISRSRASISAKASIQHAQVQALHLPVYSPPRPDNSTESRAMAFLNDNGVPHLFDPMLIPASADIGIKEDALDKIIVREPFPSSSRAPFR